MLAASAKALQADVYLSLGGHAERGGKALNSEGLRFKWTNAHRCCRVVAAWIGHPVLGDRLVQQNAQLHEAVKRVAQARS
jgi:hypothetical protein